MITVVQRRNVEGERIYNADERLASPEVDEDDAMRMTQEPGREGESTSQRR